MSEKTNLVLEDKESQALGLGEIVIAPEVLEIIIGIAATNVDGVYGMRGNFSANVTELLGKSVRGKGVYLKIEEDDIKVDVYCYLHYGVVVPKVALQIQEQVKEQVDHMTDIQLSEVNVHIVGLIPEKVSTPNIDELFEMDSEDE